jgi:uncharacterized protein YgbK (DUF1537 family)
MAEWSVPVAAMRSILVLADDLTGALEAGAKFAAHNFRALVTTRRERRLDFPVTIVDTESRHLSPADAAAAIAFAPAGAEIVYKKTDSALRGNIACELQALHRALPDATLSYIPAYPEIGRTARAGSVLIHGIPAHLSDFAQDQLNPVTTSSIAELLGEDLPCTIYDGESPADVRAAIAITLRRPGRHIIAGPASVAAAIAAYFEPKPTSPKWPRIEKCLIVNGSRHMASIAQTAYALDKGCISTDPAAPWILVTPSSSPAATSVEFAAAVRKTLACEIDRAAPDAIVAFGGDTAFAILESMNRPDLQPIGEILPGVPISKVDGRALYLITKAGSFGEADVICRLKGLLHAIQ